MSKLNLQKERDFLSTLNREAAPRVLTEEEQWKLDDKLAQPLKKSMIKGLKEDIGLLNDAVKELEKPGEKWDLSNFLVNLQGIASNISEIEKRAKRDLKYN